MFAFILLMSCSTRIVELEGAHNSLTATLTRSTSETYGLYRGDGRILAKGEAKDGQVTFDLTGITLEQGCLMIADPDGRIVNRAGGEPGLEHPQWFAYSRAVHDVWQAEGQHRRHRDSLEGISGFLEQAEAQLERSNAWNGDRCLTRSEVPDRAFACSREEAKAEGMVACLALAGANNPCDLASYFVENDPETRFYTAREGKAWLQGRDCRRTVDAIRSGAVRPSDDDGSIGLEVDEEEARQLVRDMSGQSSSVFGELGRILRKRPFEACVRRAGNACYNRYIDPPKCDRGNATRQMMQGLGRAEAAIASEVEESLRSAREAAWALEGPADAFPRCDASTFAFTKPSFMNTGACVLGAEAWFHREGLSVGFGFNNAEGQRLGFQHGDRFIAIGRTPFTDLDVFERAFRGLDGSSVEAMILRDGTFILIDVSTIRPQDRCVPSPFDEPAPSIWQSGASRPRVRVPKGR